MTPGNPNDPGYPYGGGTDNPSGRTDGGNPGGGVMVETGLPFLSGPRFYGVTVSQLGGNTDTVLPAGFAAVPSSGAGFSAGSDYGNERAADPAGVGSLLDPARSSGQDETAGATEVTPDASPSAFPEPNP